MKMVIWPRIGFAGHNGMEQRLQPAPQDRKPDEAYSESRSGNSPSREGAVHGRIVLSAPPDC
jgi:hypothetical protein